MRGRADAHIHHASLVMTTGDPREAAALGTQALGWAGPPRSGRITHYLRTLNRAADPHVGIPDVADLRDRIRTTLAA